MARKDVQEALEEAKRETAPENGSQEAPPEETVDYTTLFEGVPERDGKPIVLRDVAPRPFALRKPEPAPGYVHNPLVAGMRPGFRYFPLAGTYVGPVKRMMDDGRGGKEERTLHEMQLTHKGTGETMKMRVWGATILDDRMTMVDPGTFVVMTRLHEIGEGKGKKSAPDNYIVQTVK